jgi:hypothetical protein
MLTREQLEEIQKLSEPLIEWINNNCDFETEIRIDYTKIKVHQTLAGITVDKFIK